MTSASYSKPENVLVQRFEGETVLFHLESERYYSLDPVGSRMYELLLELPSVEAVVERLLAEFDAAREQIVEDLGRLIGELKASGLLEG